MVHGKFSTKQSSFLLSEKQRESLIDNSTQNQAVIKKRNKLPELITRLVEDIILYEDSMLLPPKSDEKIWNDLSNRLPDDEDYLDNHQARTTSYELGFMMGTAIGMLIPEGQNHKQNLVCGLLDGSLGKFGFTSESGISNLNDIQISAQRVFSRYRREVITATFRAREIGGSIPSGIFNELDEHGIEETGGVSEMILRRSGTNSLRTCSEYVNSILDETSIEKFDKLADLLSQDISKLKTLEYNDTLAEEVLETIYEMEDNQMQDLSAIDVSTDMRGVHKNTVGRLLLKISNTPKSKPPWTQRPLIRATKTNTSRCYNLTKYGKLTLISLFERSEENREWLHAIASYEDQKNSNYDPKIDLSKPDSHLISDDLSLAKEALKEVE